MIGIDDCRVAGMVVLLRFLHDFGYPWLALRMAVRDNCSDRIDFTWNLVMPWFRSTGKYNYAAMSVNVGLLNELMGGTFQKVCGGGVTRFYASSSRQPRRHWHRRVQRSDTKQDPFIESFIY